MPKLGGFDSAAQPHPLTYTHPRARGKTATLHCLDCLVDQRAVASARTPAHTNPASLLGQPRGPASRFATKDCILAKGPPPHFGDSVSCPGGRTPAHITIRAMSRHPKPRGGGWPSQGKPRLKVLASAIHRLAPEWLMSNATGHWACPACDLRLVAREPRP